VSAQPLDLSRPRDVGGIVNTTFEVYARHFGLFAALAFGTVVFVEMIVYGIGAGWLWSGYDDSYPAVLEAIDISLPVLVLGPLVTATHVQAVAILGAGRVPPFSEALQAGVAVFVPALVVVVLYTLGFFGGLLLLIVPGVYAFVAWFVSVQAAVIEGHRGTAALGRSRELVRGRWWRVFGISLLICAIPAIAAGTADIGLRALAEQADSMGIYLAGRMVTDAAFYSFTALAATLLYFDLRAREEVPAPATPARPATG
jgi:hypothetical protein